MLELHSKVQDVGRTSNICIYTRESTKEFGVNGDSIVSTRKASCPDDIYTGESTKELGVNGDSIVSTRKAS